MQTTRRGFFGLVAGALAGVPVLKRLPVARNYSLYEPPLGYGCLATGTVTRQLDPTDWSDLERNVQVIGRALAEDRDRRIAPYFTEATHAD